MRKDAVQIHVIVVLPFGIMLKHFLLLSLCSIACANSTCDTFNKNVEVLIGWPLRRPSTRLINSCIDESFHNSRIVRTLNFYDQNITVLRTACVKNLPELIALKFMNCAIETLEANAFVNLPKLQRLQIEYSLLKVLPDNAFNGLNVHELILSHSQMNYIRNLAFVNMSNLLDAFLMENGIDSYNREWFADSSKLQSINLRSNKLRFVQRRAFYETKLLQEINLSKNLIGSVEDDAFDGLASLNYLDLSSNFIKTLSTNVFSSSPVDALKLIELKLSANKLNYLPMQFFSRIRVDRIHLHGNPWICSCYERLEISLRSSDVKIEGDDYCRDLPICVVQRGTASGHRKGACRELYDIEATVHFQRQLLPAKEKLQKNDCVQFDLDSI